VLEAVLVATAGLVPACAAGGGPAGSGRPPVTGDRRHFTDASLGFRIGHPVGFVVRSQDVSRLAFQPRPLASIFFMNPTMAAGDLAGIEPPDLQLRVYRAEGAPSLAAWLAAAGFLPAGGRSAAKSVGRGGVDGLEVCAATLVAPGCSIYVLGRGRVYQLTPISREGEAMIETFELLA